MHILIFVTFSLIIFVKGKLESFFFKPVCDWVPSPQTKWWSFESRWCDFIPDVGIWRAEHRVACWRLLCSWCLQRKVVVAVWARYFCLCNPSLCLSASSHLNGRGLWWENLPRLCASVSVCKMLWSIFGCRWLWDHNTLMAQRLWRFLNQRKQQRFSNTTKEICVSHPPPLETVVASFYAHNHQIMKTCCRIFFFLVLKG